MKLRRLSALLALATVTACSAQATNAPIPDPAVDAPKQGAPRQEIAVLSGGCFWGVQAVFEHVRGVRQVWAGYSGGAANTAHYDEVSDGNTGHAESVQIAFDPSVISYGQLLKVYFAVAHDPTTLNRQGPDAGTQYRSEIFYNSPEQQKIAQAYIAQLDAAHVFDRSIVTLVQPLHGFYPAESYHQDFFSKHPNDAYIVINDAPKVAHLKQQFPQLYKPEEQLVEVNLH